MWRRFWSADEKRADPAGVRHHCWPFTLDGPGWTQANVRWFVKSIRSCSASFVLSSTLCFHRLASPWCQSLADNVTAFSLKGTVWLLTHTHTHTPSPSLYVSSASSSPICSIFFEDNYQTSTFLTVIFPSCAVCVSVRFQKGWESLNSELSSSAKGHSPNHPGWQTRPVIISPPLREQKMDDKTIA